MNTEPGGPTAEELTTFEYSKNTLFQWARRCEGSSCMTPEQRCIENRKAKGLTAYVESKGPGRAAGMCPLPHWPCRPTSHPWQTCAGQHTIKLTAILRKTAGKCLGAAQLVEKRDSMGEQRVTRSVIACMRAVRAIPRPQANCDPVQAVRQHRAGACTIHQAT